MRTMRMRGSDLMLFFILLQMVTGDNTGLMVTSCDACHEHASCQTLVDSEGLTSSFLSLTCVCNEGFFGDGLTCSPGTLAPSGVSQVPSTGGRRRRAAVSPNNVTHVLFNCGFSQCPDGQDCLSTPGGYQQCADPCFNYKVLDDAWRSTSSHANVVGVHCDQSVVWVGWYRMMLNNISASMPDKCVSEFMCGTHAPMWLNSTHPKLNDQIIQSSACAAWSGSCCLWESKPIHVKACPGNYYVYKFVPPPVCSLAYCAAVNASQPTITPITTTIKAPDTTTTNNFPHVRFNCGFSQCPDGQDCLNSTGGYQQCADPCSNYKVLDDAWRSTSSHINVVGLHCDQSVVWVGWYRMMLNNISASMPDKCVSELMCGTHAPMWLNSAHPKLNDQIIQSSACAAWSGSCCQWEIKPIHVKACPGNYYVYKFVRPEYCWLAYCAAVNASQPTITPITTTIKAPDTTTNNSPHVRFNCGFSQCPDGHDCLSTLGGYQQCADPCSNYKVLDDAWRSTSSHINVVGLHCDQSVVWVGWYRMMLNNTSASMPDKCVSEFMCGTHAPMWLNSAHPKLNDQIIQSSACAAWSGSCCLWETKPIHVKACPGNYYVYKFVPPPVCSLAYCAVKHPDSWTPELICGRNELQLGLPLANLAVAGLDASTAHLVDRFCSGYRALNGTAWYRVNRTDSLCGNTLTTNRTHAIYSNSLFVYPVQNMSLGDSNKNPLSLPLSIPFSCAYPLETESDLSVAVRPRPPFEGVAGVGSKAPASMSLYHNSNYTEPYPQGPVSLPLGSALYVGMSVEERDSRFVVVLEDCYATHTPNPDGRAKYFLVQNKCPSDGSQVTVDESGSSLQARFSALLFLYQGDYQDIFLHCSLSLCDQRSFSCSPVCSRRKSRSAFKSNPLKPLTIGPITWGKTLG